jgi:hypothetical protein
MCLTVISFTVRPPTGSGALNPGRSIMTKHARVFTLSPKKKIGVYLKLNYSLFTVSPVPRDHI